MTCTFFGHRHFDDKFIPKLRNVIEDLILNYNVNKFYVVLAYLPTKTNEFNNDYSYTIMPEGFEKVPKNAAIVYRNNWMLNKSDFVVSYITRPSLSGAAEFFLKAEKLNKICINIAR